jgi:hypothetical protein
MSNNYDESQILYHINLFGRMLKLIKIVFQREDENAGIALMELYLIIESVLDWNDTVVSNHKLLILVRHFIVDIGNALQKYKGNDKSIGIHGRYLALQQKFGLTNR